MGSEDDEAQQARLFTSTDAMESLVLDHSPHPFLSNSDYRSAMSGSAALEESHPLAASSNKRDNSPHKSFKDSYRKGFEDNSPSSRKGNSFREADLVEPPSYADAIFTPYMGEGSGNGNSREVGDSSSSLHSFPVYSDTLIISVTQPQKTQESGSSIVPGGSNYVTYLITTKTNIPEFRGSDFTVRRRFRDVVTLADRLAEAHRGYFIPPRPDKSIVESQVMQKAEFIEQRRVALERYLFRLASHPILRRSNELRLFLQFQGKLPLMPTTDIASRMLDGAVNLPRQLFGESSTVIPQEAVQPAKGGRDLVRLFKELKQSMTNDWGGTKPAVVEEDKDFLERKEKLQELEKQLSDASQQVLVLSPSFPLSRHSLFFPLIVQLFFLHILHDPWAPHVRFSTCTARFNRRLPVMEPEGHESNSRVGISYLIIKSTRPARGREISRGESLHLREKNST